MAVDVLAGFGLEEFLADIDAGRTYWREGDSVLHHTLTWASEVGFGEVLRKLGLELDFRSAHAYRNRHELMMMRTLMRAMARG